MVSTAGSTAIILSLSQSKMQNIVVRCKLCAGSKQLSTANNSTCDVAKHLLGQHSDVKQGALSCQHHPI